MSGKKNTLVLLSVVIIMKTHFYITYPGNKRKEMKGLYPYLDFTNINTIVEPFAGTCAISYLNSKTRINIYPKR